MSSRAWSVVVLLAAVLGCTKPNPRSCTDGACTDPGLPFCDVDGAIAGDADTCIAVACTPNEHASCRGEIAVRCNADGTNYDLVECPLGCSDVSGGCAACNVDDDCDNPTPVCETTTRACRGCKIDDECASDVCDLDTGRCLEASEVQYASPTGADAGSCSSGIPCSLPHAVAQAGGDPLRSTVRLAPGRYTRDLTVTTGTVRLVGSDTAVIGGQDPTTALLQVNVGATLLARNLRFDLVRDRIACGTTSATTPVATLRLDDVAIDTLRTGININLGCNVTLRRVTITSASSTEAVAAITIGNEASLDADGLRVASTSVLSSYVSFAGASTARVINSVFANSQVVVGQQSASKIAFSTIVVGSSGIRDTSGSGVTAENNVIVGTGDAVECTICTKVKTNLLFPQSAAATVASNTVADPQLVDSGAGDYHLRATSPAVNAAVPSPGLSTDHDYDGAVRPQGPAPDIGAFERAP